MQREFGGSARLGLGYGSDSHFLQRQLTEGRFEETAIFKRHTNDRPPHVLSLRDRHPSKALRVTFVKIDLPSYLSSWFSSIINVHSFKNIGILSQHTI